MLLKPDPDTSVNGSVPFEWQIVQGSLQANQVFELTFWRSDQDPLTQGFGPVGSATGTQTSVTFGESSGLGYGGYLWGVRVRETDPSGRVSVTMASEEGRKFTYTSGGDDGGNGGGGTPTKP
jgi:hypothetical protein